MTAAWVTLHMRCLIMFDSLLIVMCGARPWQACWDAAHANQRISDPVPHTWEPTRESHIPLPRIQSRLTNEIAWSLMGTSLQPLAPVPRAPSASLPGPGNRQQEC